MFKIAGNGPAQVKLTPDYAPDTYSPPPFSGGQLVWHLVREAQEYGQPSPLLAPDITPIFDAAAGVPEPFTPLQDDKAEGSIVPSTGNPAAITPDGSAADGDIFAVIERISAHSFSDNMSELNDAIFSADAPGRASTSAISASTFDTNGNSGGAIAHFATVDSGLTLMATEFILI
jgi:hypothetical protein